MKKRKSVLVIIKVSLIVFTLVLLVLVSIRTVKWYKVRKETLSFLREFDSDVYLASDSLFVLDKENFAWVEVPTPPGFYPSNYGDADISDSGFVFYLGDQLEIRLLGDPRSSIHFSAPSNAYPPVSISRNLDLAYTANIYDLPYRDKLLIYDANSQITKQVDIGEKRIVSLCWPEADSNGIYWTSSDGSIYYTDKNNLKTTFQFEGFWPKSLANGDIVYWRTNEIFHVCHRYQADNQEHVELYRTPENILLGYDCDPTGRYLVISVFRYLGMSLIPRNVITIYDTKTQKEYQLPIKKDAKTGVVFILPASILENIRLRDNN